MTYKRRPSQIFPIFAVTLALILLLAQSYVYLYIDNKQTGEEFPNHCPCAQDPSIRYSFENLTMIGHGNVLKIQNIWKQELSKAAVRGKEETIEGGGQPERILVVSTWRSGSSYVGSIVRSRPGSHYFFEPLLNSFQDRVVRTDSEVQVAMGIIENLFHCRDEGGRHMTKMRRDDSFFSHNPQLFAIAHRHNIRWDPTFVTLMCRRSPVLAMKTVRLRLTHVSTLLQYEKLNLKVIYLVRDPQATIRSRLKLPWCEELPGCADLSRFCSDLEQDFNVAKQLEEKYPRRFMVLHYEDILTRSRTTNQLAHFLNMSQDALFALKIPKTQFKLTKGVSPMFRNTRYDCSKAIQLWGYTPDKSLLLKNSTKNLKKWRN